MALYMTEYGGYVAGRPEKVGVPTEPPIQGQTASSATTSTGFLSAATRMVRLSADANAWILFTASSASTSVATSTNACRVQANVAPEYHYVVPGSRFTVLST